MNHPIRFCIALHNHQPVGNFDHVFEHAYRQSYLPFLDVFEDFPQLRISLHASGPLMEWLDEHYDDYLERLSSHVAAGRIEIIGGAFYEPILPSIPRRDRVGQITRYTRWLESRLGAHVNGVWIAERVWEQALASDLACAGAQFTLLDDYHFKNAGLTDGQLHGYFLTEDEGNVLRVFPGSERLRYLIPFGQPHETIDYLGQIAAAHSNALVVFGDDGEKFGSWPETNQHVYQNGWLRSFFGLLAENEEWIKTTTLTEAMTDTPPLGSVYLPDASYREMTEWALPTRRQNELQAVTREMEGDERWPRIQPFLRGGFWRNFRIKYPESGEMYSRMMMVSRRLEEATRDGIDGPLMDDARRELYRGQCNCSYWHGAFGGIYLPHLRNAVYNHLISADNLLDQATGKPSTFVEATADDFDFDARQEIRLSNNHLTAFIAPARGGQIFELDVRSIAHNLLATMSRREEAYHQKVRCGSDNNGDHVTSIHDRVVCKQEGLDRRLQYDQSPRKSLLDHFYEDGATLESVAAGEAAEQGDFLFANYDAKVRRNPDRIQVVQEREGQASGCPVRITKGVTLSADSTTLEIAYRLEGLPRDRQVHFAVELNFSGLPADADDRFFYDQDRQHIGHLGAMLDLRDVQSLGLADEWLGIDVQLQCSRDTNFWTFPVQTVSQSEGGVELVHQLVVVQPHWYIMADAEGHWSMTMSLSLDTAKAEQHSGQKLAAATV